LAGLASAVAVWFLSPTPAYFITWGRYPLLLGSALLPIALLAAIYLIEQERLSVWIILFAGATLVAVVFSQIRLIVFYFAFVAVYAFAFWIAHPMQRKIFYRIGFLASIAIAFGALWFGALIMHGSTFQSILALNDAAPVIDLGTAQAVMSSHHGIELLVLALMGLIVGFLRRTFVATIFSSWYIVLALISIAAQILGGRPYLEPSLVVLMGFLPIALFVGELAQIGTSRIPTLASIALIALVGMAGVRDMVNVVNPTTILYFDADQHAMEWIKSSTPYDAKFLINSFAWFDSTFVPADGGAWIPTFTGRSIDYFSGESNAEEIAQWMNARQISFVYLGRRAGSLTNSDFLFQPEAFNLIYNREGVRIYQLRNPTH
jgi:hypothetical protein